MLRIVKKTYELYVIKIGENNQMGLVRINLYSPQWESAFRFKTQMFVFSLNTNGSGIKSSITKWI